MDITATIRTSEMTPFQLMAVAICLMINMIDGFDVLAISFIAPTIADEWSLPPSELGILFSVGLAGMVMGALFIAPLADRFGRRALILVCLCVISAGMILSGLTQSLMQLAPMRFFTGLGVGGMLASINTMTAEYSSDRRRQLAISFLQAGYPVGGIIAGLSSAYLISNFGWRSVFTFGGVMSALMIPIVYFQLPESLDYLLSRRKDDSLAKVNAVLQRLDHDRIAELPEPAKSNSVSRNALAEIFSRDFIASTFGIWLCFVMVMCGWYFVVNWTPKALVDAGLSLDAGISGGVLLSLGGVIGGLSLGYLAGRFPVNRLVAIFMVLSVSAMAVFGQLEANLTVMLIVAFCIGFFLAGAMIGLYAIVPEIYPPRVRNTGTGWALGIGRFGAVIGPYAAGLLIEAGWERDMYYPALGLPLLLSMLVVLQLRTRAAG